MIRSVAAHELPALLELVEAAYRGDAARRGWTHEANLLDGRRTSLAALRASFDDPRQCILVAAEGDTMLGTITAIDKGCGVGGLGMLAVLPDRQTSGLGRRLLAAAETHAAQHFAARTMEMTVIKQRPELIDYYMRRGYRLTGTEEPFPHGDERFGIPLSAELVFVVLARDLPAETSTSPGAG